MKKERYAIGEVVPVRMQDGEIVRGEIEDRCLDEYAIRTPEWREKKWYRSDEIIDLDESEEKRKDVPTMASDTQQTPIGPEIPTGYTIDQLGVTSRGTVQLVVRYNGKPTNSTPDGKGEYWHMDRDGAIQAAWCDYYGQIADERNKGRDETDEILAWRLPNGQVYTVDHLTFYVPEIDHTHIVVNFNDGTPKQHVWFSSNMDYVECVDSIEALILLICASKRIDPKTVNWRHIELEEITINSHSANYEIANLLCEHCGCSAVDDDILYKYRLLNEGWNTDGFYDDDDEC